MPLQRTAFLAACIVAGGGCDRVFGVAPPAAIVAHEGSYQRDFIFEDESGVVVRRIPYEPSELVARLFQDNEELPIAWDYTTSSFAFDAVENEPYRIVLQAESERTELQSNRTSLALHDTVFRRPDTQFPTGPTEIRGTLTNPQPGYHRLVTTGVWAELAFLPTPIDPSSSELAVVWPEARGLVSTAKHDRVFIIAEEDRGPYRAIGAWGTATLDMVTGKNELASTLASSSLELWCTTVTAPLQVIAARVAEAFPVGEPLMPVWGVYGAPAPDEALGVLLFLAESNDGIEHADVELVVPYDLPLQAQASASRIRAVATGDSTQLPAFAILRQFVPVASAGCPTSPETTISAGTLNPPSNFQVAGKPLDYGGSSPISLAGTTEVELTWEARGGELHGITLYDVTNATTYSQRVRNYRTTEPRVVIESALLVDGHRYIAFVHTNRGYLDAASGNFIDFGFPFEVAVVTSPVFEVRR